MKGLLSCSLVLLYLIQGAYCQGCALNYTIQPPTGWSCNPVGMRSVRVFLSCSTDPPTRPFNWYRTLDESQAGISGTRIDNNVDGYTINIASGVGSQLFFEVSNATIGFYWCEINDTRYNSTLLRPSTVTPICQNSYSSLPLCTPGDITNAQLTVQECASTNNFPRPSFPDNCVPFVSSSYPTDTSTSFPSSVTPSIGSSTAASIGSSTTASPFSTSTTPPSPNTPSSTPSQTQTPNSSPQPSSTVNTAPVASDNSPLLLFILIGVCGFLALVALTILIAILVLCYLTKQSSSGSSRGGVGGTSKETGPVPAESGQVQIVAIERRRDDSPEAIAKPALPPVINGNGHPRGISFSNPVYQPHAFGSINSSKNDVGAQNGTVLFPKLLPPDNAVTSSNPYSTGDKLPEYSVPDMSKKRSRSKEFSEERDIVSPSHLQSPPPPPPPPLSSEATYDNPNEVAPSNYILPRLISSAPKQERVIYDTPIDGMTEEKFPDYDEPSSSPLYQNEAPEILPQSTVVIKEGMYEDPWGPLPTGIKRTGSKSRTGSTKSRSVNHSASPNLFDDPQYDSPSPRIGAPIHEEQFGYSTVD